MSTRRNEVLFITGANPMRGGGGLESYVRAHALAANDAGFCAHVFCVARRSRVSTAPFGVLHEVGVPVRTVRGAMAAVYAPLLARALRAHIIRSDCIQPVLIHAFGPYAVVGARLARVLRGQRIETIQVTSAYTTLEQEHRALVKFMWRERSPANAIRYLGRYAWAVTIGNRSERLGYDASRLLLVNYESVRRLLVAEFGAGREIRIVPYGSHSAFSACGSAMPQPQPIATLEPRDAPLVVCVSRHDARKGVGVLLQALGFLRATHVPFRACIVGRGELIRAHRRLVAKLGLEGCVAITGQVPDVTPYLRHADVFVLPSLSESSGSLSLLEALQEGVSVVASDCDGIPEDVTDGDSALLVAPGDERALAAAIARLLGDPSLRRRLGERGRGVYEDRFSAEGFSASLAGIYAELGLMPERRTTSSISARS